MSGPEHRVEFVNDAHRTLFGSDEWVGKTIREAFPDTSGQGFSELLDTVYSTGEPPVRDHHRNQTKATGVLLDDLLEVSRIVLPARGRGRRACLSPERRASFAM
jgi:PAS fold